MKQIGLPYYESMASLFPYMDCESETMINIKFKNKEEKIITIITF